MSKRSATLWKMDKQSYILITGGAGFIGSVLAGYLNQQGYSNMVVADRFNHPYKSLNLEGKSVTQKIESRDLFSNLEKDFVIPDFIFHLGARINTLKSAYSEQENQNMIFAQRLWNYAVQNQVPFIYASSAATYGNEDEYSDDEALLGNLHPVGGYGLSKHEFDLWVTAQEKKPPLWAGLKFFNVYGPNEYHKGGRASLVLRCFNEANTDGVVRLFGSNKPNIPDGGHLRDFIYVIDVAKVCGWFLEQWASGNRNHLSGVYNVGTAIPRTYNDLAFAVFKSLGKEPRIRYEPIPEAIRDDYKDTICSKMDKLRNAGYHEKMYTLEEGVGDYIENFLKTQRYY